MPGKARRELCPPESGGKFAAQSGLRGALPWTGWGTVRVRRAICLPCRVEFVSESPRRNRRAVTRSDALDRSLRTAETARWSATCEPERVQIPKIRWLWRRRTRIGFASAGYLSEERR